MLMKKDTVTRTLTVDGVEVEVPDGSTLLDAAEAAGAKVPTLCDSDALAPYGACRMCLVEVEGGKPRASCHTPAMDGMVVKTSSPAARAHPAEHHRDGGQRSPARLPRVRGQQPL